MTNEDKDPMGADIVPQYTANPLAAVKDRPKKRLIAIDAARGLALIGLMAIHILPDADEDTGESTLSWHLFSGDSAALFALLAGVGLALSSGGSAPHQGQRMTGDRVGLAARAMVIGALGLVISAILPWDPPAYSILLYYAVFFLLAIPFLLLRSRALFAWAAVFGLTAPVLKQQLGPALPESSAWNHTVVNLVTEPGGSASELLLIGSYPALVYMTYLLAGLGLGRLDLRRARVQGLIAGVGAALAVLSNVVSFLLLRAGGYEALLATPGMTSQDLDEALVFGSEGLPDTSWWWLAMATPHTNTPLAIASSLGTGMLVLGVFLLIAPCAERLLKPLAAMGAMTLTLYFAHLLALAPELHYDDQGMWFVLHLIAAAALAWFWQRKFGQGPMERVVTAVTRNARQIVADDIPDTTPGGSATESPRGATGTTAAGESPPDAGQADDHR
jgi:uncharacterized membrane protein